MRWAHKLAAVVTLALGFVPIALLLGNNPATPVAWVYVACCAGLLALVQALEALLPNRHRLVGLPLLIALCALLFLLFYDGLNALLFALPLLIYSVAALALARNFASRLMGIQQLVAGASTYAAAYLLSFLWEGEAVQPALRLWCMVYLVLGVLLLNIASLEEAAGKGNAASLRWGNLAITVAFLLMAAVLVNIGAIRDFVGLIGRGVGAALAWISSLFGEEAGEPGPGPGGAMDDQFPLAEGEGGMPAWLEAALDVLLTAVAVAAALALLALAFIALGRLFRKLYRKLRAWMTLPGAPEEDFSDEQFSLMDWKQVRVQMRDGLRRAIRRITYRLPRWDDLTDRQRVRLAMEGFLYRGGRREPDAALTAREHLSGPSARGKGDSAAFADAYDRARYSSLEVSREEADNARKFLEY